MDFDKLERRARKRVWKLRGAQVHKEQKAIADRHAREDCDLYWHTVVLIVIAVLGLIATIITSIETRGSDGHEGWIVFLCACVGPVVLAIVLASLRERFAAERRIKPPAPESLQPSRAIPPYLTQQVDDLREELLGTKSRYGRTKSELEEINARARKAREQLELRCTDSGAQYLRDALSRSVEVVERTDATLEALKQFRGKVEAFLQECHDSIKGMDPALRDLELVREVNDLHARTLELEHQAQEVIVEIVGQLQTRMIGVRSDVRARFGTHGIKLSLENPDDEPLHSLTLLQHSVETFEPGRIS